MSELENMLVTLDDVCDQQEFKVNQLAHQRLLSGYAQSKNMDIEKAKGLSQLCSVRCFVLHHVIMCRTCITTTQQSY